MTASGQFGRNPATRSPFVTPPKFIETECAARITLTAENYCSPIATVSQKVRRKTELAAAKPLRRGHVTWLFEHGVGGIREFDVAELAERLPKRLDVLD
jgi:hypothetical protein